MNEAYNVGFKDGASAGYKLAIEDMKLDKKPQIMKKYEGDYAALLARHNALVEAVAWEREVEWLNDLITEQYACVSEMPPEEEEISVSYFEARAEVDRLLSGDK